MKKERCVCFLTALLLLLGGCAQTMEEGPESFAEESLAEPAQTLESWEEAERRDLYDARVLPAAVFPDVEEYSFEDDGALEQFAAYPGDPVRKGDLLASADTERLDASMEALEEQLQEMEESFEKYCQKVEEDLLEPEGEARRLKEIVETYAELEPEEYVPASGAVSGGDAETSANGGSGSKTADGTDILDPAYAKWVEEYEKWETEYHRFEGNYSILAHQNDTARQQLAQRTELYELDHAYQLLCLKKLKARKDRCQIKASADGEVVAAGRIENGQWVAGGQNLIAVGDISRKLIKCEYLPQTVLSGAEDVYALIDGKRREIRSLPMDPGEYSRLSARGDPLYSTFELSDGGEAEMGSFVVIVILENSRRNVLTVPEDAVGRDGLEYFVNRRKQEGSERVPVTPGMSDGVYTEILSGLSEGDQVLMKEPMTPGEGRVTLARGDFSGRFSGSGYFYYPRTERTTNPIAHGTVYFQEYQVEPYQHVQKGDVIAAVRVQEDAVARQRCQVRLDRLRERLEDLIRKGEEENRDAIEQKQEEIRDVEEEIAAMDADFACGTIKAVCDGIVVQLAEHDEEDLLDRDSLLAVIAHEEQCYVTVENTGHVLHYGNEVTVSYQNRSGQTVSTPGRVANVSPEGVSAALGSEYAWIRVPAQDAGEMSAVSALSGLYFQPVFQVEGKVRQMKDVVLVPKSAVWSLQGQTYVMVVDPDGKARARSFVAGGYDSSCYWAAEGLTEGMVLCLK